MSHFVTAPFIRFEEPTRSTLASLRRWLPESDDPLLDLHPAIGPAVNGTWMHPNQVWALAAILSARRVHYDSLAHDLSRPGWARQEWSDAVQEHTEALVHVRAALDAAGLIG